MTLIFHEGIDLPEVVRRSAVIVVVDRKGSAKAGEDPVDSVEIKEVLLAKFPVKPGDILALHEANESFYKAMAEHIKEHGYQGAPSPIFPEYKSSATREESPVIVFLFASRDIPTRYQYVVDGAYESMLQIKTVADEIRKLEASKREKPSARPRPEAP